MNIIVSPHPGLADFDWLRALPRQSMDKDWFGHLVSPALEFAFGVDEEYLWFLAARQAKAEIPGDALPGKFTPELWKYDVAEFFLCAPVTGKYWEFNLCPNGAWWACAFDAPRSPSADIPTPANVETQAECRESDWTAMARIPLDSLLPLVGGQPGKDSLTGRALAFTGILDTPHQIFLTSAPSKEGQPDFHRPDTFPPLSFPA